MNIQRHMSDNKPGNIEVVGSTTQDQIAVEHSRPIVRPVAKTIVFGPFRLDCHNATLKRDHEQLTLTPKAFALLSYLVESTGQLLTKDAIFAQIWPGLVVTDAALTVCIREIRKVLGDSSKTPRYVETVHKRGFRFICDTSNPSGHGDNALGPVIGQQSTPNLVGRDKPLGILEQCLELALTSVRQLAFVTGEPGIGKTSMVEEFLHLNFSSAEIWIAKGRCIEHYGTGEAYLPILDALGDLAQKESDALAEILAHYAPTWLEHLPALNGTFDHPHVRDNLGDINPERMLRELTSALEAITEKRPLILVLDDLHWSDHATIDLLSFLARRANPARLLIIGVYRPADATVRNHPIKHLKEDLQLRDRCITIPLEFLSQQHIAAYLSEVFPGHNFPKQFPDVIHQQSDGNPLFMVNLLKYIQNTKLLKNVDGQWQLMEDISINDRCIPDDLELMINQQVEQLDLECQTLLEAASIASEPGGIAVQFTLAEVTAALGLDELVAESCLESLVRNGHFLHSFGVTEWPDGTFSSDYEFTHALYQSVLYERVSAVRKVQLHNRLGLRLEKGYGFRNGEIANKLAVHFENGRDYSRAVTYLKKAAETAARRGANREAIHTLEKAKQLLTKLPQTTERQQLELSLLLSLGPAITASQGNATPEIETCYLRARELCEQMGEHSEQFRVMFGLRSFYVIRGELNKAHQLAQSLLDLATALDDPGFLLEAHVGLASSEFFAGNHQASHQHALQGIALYEKDTHAGHAALYGLDPGVFCYARAGQTLWPIGFPDQALDYEKQAVDLAETLDHPYSLVFAIHNLTLVLLYRRDGEAALESAKRGKSLALKHGFSFLSAWAFHLTAWAFAMMGDSDNARLEIERAIAADRPKAPATDSFLAVFLAEAYRFLGDYKNGLSSLAIPCKEYSYDVEQLYLKAELLLLSDDSNETINKAEALYKEARETSHQQRLKAYELRTAISLSKLLMGQNKNLEAYECLDDVTCWFQEGFDTTELYDAEQLMGQLGNLLEKESPATDSKRTCGRTSPFAHSSLPGKCQT